MLRSVNVVLPTDCCVLPSATVPQAPAKSTEPSGAVSRRTAPESWMTLPSHTSVLLTDNLQEETINRCILYILKPMECSDIVYVGERYDVCVCYGNLLVVAV